MFLFLGERLLIDGFLHGVAGTARGAARGLARAQSGSLQRYAWLVLIGLCVGLVWSWGDV